jgi:hypothetical protein
VYEFNIEPGKVTAVSRAKIIQHSHITLSMEMFRKMAADKSGTAGDQDSHRLADMKSPPFLLAWCKTTPFSERRSPLLLSFFCPSAGCR